MQNKNQHYVSQFYIKLFSINGNNNTIYVNDHPKPNKIRTVARQNHYNRLVNNFDNSFDDLISKCEQLIAPEYKAELEILLKNKSITSESDITFIKEFMSIMFSNSIKHRELMKGLYNCLGDILPLDKTPDNIKKQHMLITKQLKDSFLDAIKNKVVYSIYSEYGSFYTSDNPVITYDSKACAYRGISLKNSDIMFPACPNMLLIFTNKNDINEYNDWFVLNSIIINNRFSKFLSSFIIPVFVEET